METEEMKDARNEENEGILAARSFSLLRKSSRDWRLDAAGYWSYPAILFTPRGEPLWLFLILGAIPIPEKKRTALFRPKAVVLTRAHRTEVIRYENLRLGRDCFPSESWNKPIAMFPHKSVKALSYNDLEKREAELMSQYPAAAEAMITHAELPPTFIASYLSLLQPAFLPYVRKLAPAFFRALGVEKTP